MVGLINFYFPSFHIFSLLNNLKFYFPLQNSSSFFSFFSFLSYQTHCQWSWPNEEKLIKSSNEAFKMSFYELYFYGTCFLFNFSFDFVFQIIILKLVLICPNEPLYARINNNLTCFDALFVLYRHNNLFSSFILLHN